MSINKLRKRVGMPDMSLANLTADPNTPFPGISLPLQEIRRERRVELAGDGYRFKDLLRWRAGEQINNPKTIQGMKLTDAYKVSYPKDANGKSQVDNVLRDAQGMSVYILILQQEHGTIKCICTHCLKISYY